MSNSVTLKLYAICEWTAKIAMLTLCWLFFTILGIGLLGFMPATSALFSMTRQHLLGEQPPLLKTFFHYYRQAFIDMNILGGLLILITGILYFNLTILIQHLAEIPMFMAIPFFMGLLIFSFFLIHLFPVYSQYQLKKRHYFKHTFTMALLHPLRSLLMVLWTAAIIFLSLLSPFLFLFFTMGLIAWGNNFIALKGYQKIKTLT